MSMPEIPADNPLPEPSSPAVTIKPVDPLREWFEFVRPLLRYLYNHNPFYPLSAVLVLLGLHHLFHDVEASENLTDIGFSNARLWAVLAGYATLLAGTSIWIVRVGKVWDDARTILLTLVLLLVAMSVNGDKPISRHVPDAPLFLIGGLGFVLLLTETTLRAARIRLNWSLRLPMYAFFALFFLYPIGLDYCLHTIGDINNTRGLKATLFGVLLFPTAAALVTLTLMPAAIAGRAMARENGTPWTWPLYPWSLFVVLGVAVLLRAFYLTISFHPRAGTDSAFAPYFLTPFALAVAAVLFELGRSGGHRFTENLACVFPLAWLPMSLTGQPACDPSGDFLCLHMEWIGSPMQVTLAGLLVFYGYAFLRRGPAWLTPAVTSLTALAAIVGPHTVDMTTFGSPVWQPLAVAAVMSFLAAYRRPEVSLRWFVGTTFAVLSLSLALPAMMLAYRGAPVVHLILAAMLLIGLLCRDKFATLLRDIVAAAFVALAFGVMVYSARSWAGLSPELAMVYLLSLCSVIWLSWRVHRSKEFLATAALVSIAAAGQTYLSLMALLQHSGNPRGWGLLAAGVACFAAGLATTVVKSRQRETTVAS